MNSSVHWAHQGGLHVGPYHHQNNYLHVTVYNILLMTVRGEWGLHVWSTTGITQQSMHIICVLFSIDIVHILTGSVLVPK